MRKILPVLLVLMIALSFSAFGEELNIKSKSVVLIEAKTGQILFDKNKNEKLPASTLTDIMFVSSVLDELSLSEDITASNNAVSSFESDISNIAAREGEVFKAKDLLSSVMLVSAIDAKNMLCEKVADSKEAFLNSLNKKAKEIGAKDSDFSGVFKNDSETTAYDTAVILKHAIKNEKFVSVFSKRNVVIKETNKFSEERNLKDFNMFFSEDDSALLGIVGIKSGYSEDAGNVAAIYAKGADREIIAVVVGADTLTDIVNDMTSLIKYGFGSFNKVVLKKEEIPVFTEDLITYTSTQDVTFLIKNEFSKDSLKYSYSETAIEISDKNGNVLAYADVNTEEEIPIYIIITKIVLFTLLTLIVLSVAFLISGIIKHNKKKKERKEKLKQIMREEKIPEKV